MDFSLWQLNELLYAWRYTIFFPLVVVEGPIVTVLAGFLVSLKQLDFFLIYPLAVAGDLTGDVLYYLLGRWGKGGLIARWGRFVGLHAGRVKQLEDHFYRNGGKTLLLGKMTHGIGAAFLTAAGLAGMPFRRFLWYNLLGTLPKSLLLIVLGYYFGQAITKVNSYLEFLSAIVFIIAFIVLGGWAYYYGRKKDKGKPDPKL